MIRAWGDVKATAVTIFPALPTELEWTTVPWNSRQNPWTHGQWTWDVGSSAQE